METGIDLDELRHIAVLSGLKIEEEQLAQMAEDMAAIVLMMENLPDVEKVESTPMQPMILRRDEVAPSIPRDALLENAPRTRQGYFVAPGATD